jgi:hypothetical protein
VQLATHDSELLATAGSQAVNILRIAGENPISPERTTNTTVASMGILCACLGVQRARIAAHLLVDRTHIYRPQESGNARLFAPALRHTYAITIALVRSS